MDDPATCYHEAGHAVIGYLLGGEVDQLSLGGEPDEVLPERFGECRIRWTAIESPMASQPAREAMTLLAGPVAEIIFEDGEVHPSMLGPWQMDFEWAMRSAMEITRDASRAVVLIRQILASLEAYLRRDEVWAAVAQLATELDAHECLECDQVHDVLRHWLR